MKNTIPKATVMTHNRTAYQGRFVFVSSAISIFITSIFAAKLIIMQGQNGEIRNFFTAQAKSMMKGAFEVSSGDLPGECYISNEKCFGYFGITPSLLRIPLLLLGKDYGFTSSYLIAALVTGLVASCLVLFELSKLFDFWDNNVKTWDTSAAVNSKKNYLLLLLMICPGNLLLQLLRPAGQWEVIAWGSSLCMFGFFFILKWYQKPSVNNLLLSLFFFILAANARVTNGLIAFGVSLVCLNKTRNFKSGKKLTHTVLAVLIGLLPILTTLIVLYLKFNSIFPNLTLHEQVPEVPHWRSILQINGGKSVGLTFFLTNMFTYLRPDSIVLSGWNLMPVRPNLLAVTNLFPLPSGGMYNEPSSSLTNLAPISLVMAVFITLYRAKNLTESNQYTKVKAKDFNFVRLLSFSSVLGLLITFTFVTSSNRYLGDFVPGAIMFSSFGCLMIMVRREYRESKLIFYFLAALIFIGIVMNIFSTLTRARLGMI